MNFEKTMCDRLGYKYKDIFGRLEYTLNHINDLLKNYGLAFSDKELEMLNELFLKLETGKIEIIEFTRPVEKQFDVDEIVKENKLLKIHLNVMKQDGDDTQDRIDKAIEVLKLCNSKCSKEVVDILRGEK